MFRLGNNKANKVWKSQYLTYIKQFKVLLGFVFRINPILKDSKKSKLVLYLNLIVYSSIKLNIIISNSTIKLENKKDLNRNDNPCDIQMI